MRRKRGRISTANEFFVVRVRRPAFDHIILDLKPELDLDEPEETRSSAITTSTVLGFKRDERPAERFRAFDSPAQPR